MPLCALSMDYLGCLWVPGGSWVVINGVLTRVTIPISHIRVLITPLITAHEPPSNVKGGSHEASGLGYIRQQRTPKRPICGCNTNSKDTSIHQDPQHTLYDRGTFLCPKFLWRPEDKKGQKGTAGEPSTLHMLVPTKDPT